MAGMQAIARLQHRALRPKVLSNKQLSKRVRGLSGNEGSRLVSSGLLYSAVTLTAGTPDINYFIDATLFNAGTPNIQHYYDCHIKLLTTNAAGATVRILYGFDEKHDGTNLTAAELLDTTTDSVSGYLTGDVANFKEARHKNKREAFRGMIVKDMVVGLVANEPKIFNVRLPLFGRRTNIASGANLVEFLPFMLALADEGNVTFSVGVEYVHTNLTA